MNALDWVVAGLEWAAAAIIVLVAVVAAMWPLWLSIAALIYIFS